MARIAKKARSVKQQKTAKQPPRYTIRKDSLDRRYAIDKRTGKRVSLSKAEKERAKRRKSIAEVFHGIKLPKLPKPAKPSKKPAKPAKKPAKPSKKSRSEAAKKGWETRRRNEVPDSVRRRQLIEIGRQVGAFAIPEGMRMHIVGGIADRSEQFPKVKIWSDYAFARLQNDFYSRRVAIFEGQLPPPGIITTPKFDRKFGPGMGQMIRDKLAGARDLADIDQLIEDMAEDPDFGISSRELYTLYFSPEVA